MANYLRKKNKQTGAAAIEFALIASIFFTILIGILELGRVLFYMNSAAEATRLGARIAVVCNKDADGITSNMIKRLNILTKDNIKVEYREPGCIEATCKFVNVQIYGAVKIPTFIPFVSNNFSLPTFSTTLPRESMDSTDNSLCT